MTPSQWIDLGLKLVEVFVLPLIAVLISRYVRDARINAALALLNEQALLAVQRLNRTRRDLKDPSKPGTWSEEEAATLRAAAIREVMRALGNSFGTLASHYGSDMKVDGMIGRAVDAHAEATRASAVPDPSQDAHSPTLPPPTPPAPPPAASGEG